MRWWKRRKRANWPKLRTLREGDIIWVEKYPNTEPHLLVQRIHQKKKFPARTVYWYDGVFLSLVDGKLSTKKLSNAMTYAAVTKAPIPPPPDDDEDDEEDSYSDEVE